MDRPPLRTYGRIKTRTLKPRQAALIDELLPRLGVPAGGLFMSSSVHLRDYDFISMATTRMESG